MAHGHLALVAYRATIGGVVASKLDVKVLWFATANYDEVFHLVRQLPTDRYQNDAGEEVCWNLIEILQVAEFIPIESGEEVIGFITSTNAFPEWEGVTEQAIAEDGESK